MEKDVNNQQEASGANSVGNVRCVIKGAVFLFAGLSTVVKGGIFTMQGKDVQATICYTAFALFLALATDRFLDYE